MTSILIAPIIIKIKNNNRYKIAHFDKPNHLAFADQHRLVKQEYESVMMR